MTMYRIVYAPMLTTMPVVERAVLVGELAVEGVLKGTIGGHCMFLVPDREDGLGYDHAEILAMVAGEDDEEGEGRPATGAELCSAVRAMWPKKVDAMRWMDGKVATHDLFANRSEDARKMETWIYTGWTEPAWVSDDDDDEDPPWFPVPMETVIDKLEALKEEVIDAVYAGNDLFNSLVRQANDDDMEVDDGE